MIVLHICDKSAFLSLTKSGRENKDLAGRSCAQASTQPLWELEHSLRLGNTLLII